MELNDQERRALVRACWAPSLGPFAVLAAAVGLDGALDACESRLLPAEVVVKFAEAGWRLSDVPSREVAAELLLGIRIVARRRGPRGKRRPIHEIAKALDVTVPVATRAEEALNRVAGVIFQGKLRRA